MEFILKSNPKQLTDIDINKIKNIEDKIYKKQIVSNKEVRIFLDYLIFITRQKLNSDFENASYKNQCNRAQCMIHYYLEDLDVEHYLSRSYLTITNGIVDHSFLTIILNVSGIEKLYLIDPTYRQFFEKERCQKNKFTPGNFISKEDSKLVEQFLYYGYMPLDGHSAEVYGNSLFFTKESLPQPPVGIHGNIYIKSFLNSDGVISKTRNDLETEGLLISPDIEKKSKII